jgi:hypothetical protein
MPAGRFPNIAAQLRGAIARNPGAARFLLRVVGSAGVLAIAANYESSRLSEEFQEPLQFPLDLTVGEGGKYFMSLRFVKYVKRSIDEQKFVVDQGNILLPIPDNLNETTSLNYANESLGPLLGSAVEASQTNDYPGTALSKLVFGASTAAAQAVAQAAGGKPLINAASAISGVAVNPFFTSVFKNPEFRSHTFTWKLYPKNEAESEVIKRITDSIKYHILPAITNTSGVLFEYPEMLLVKLHPNDEYTYKFKPCVVKSFTANYAPSGAPSFYSGPKAAPTAVQISMQLQEIEYLTKYDYQAGKNIPVPFEQP